MSFAFVFPGQGSQSVGMLSALSEKFSNINETFDEASNVLGYDLWDLSQNGPNTQLGQTEFTQPALLTAGVAIWRVWEAQGGVRPNILAGHSLGEYTALTCAGSIKFTDAVTLVQDRGRYMQNAVPTGEGGMAAIIGLKDSEVIKVCASIQGHGVIQAVNFNAPGQVVVAGTKQAIDASVNAFKEAGAKRVLALPISIPAHSSLMSSAAEKLKARIDGIHFQMPNIPVIHNCNVEIAKDIVEIKANLVKQLDSPVKWVESIEKMASDFAIKKVIESGPGKVLLGMIRRILNGVDIAAIETPEALSQALSQEPP